MRVFNKPTRVWVNQASTLQPLNYLHGRVAIAHTVDNVTTLYFTTGDLISQKVDSTLGLETLNSQSNVFGFGDTIPRK